MEPVFVLNENMTGRQIQNYLQSNPLEANSTIIFGAKNKAGRQGEWSTYNGDILVQAENYTDDALHGIYRSWYPDGRPAVQTQYFYNKQHGLRLEWDRDHKGVANAEIYHVGQHIATLSPKEMRALDRMRFWDNAKAMLGINRRDPETLAYDQYGAMLKHHLKAKPL